jgi:hypothetical protein
VRVWLKLGGNIYGGNIYAGTQLALYQGTTSVVPQCRQN